MKIRVVGSGCPKCKNLYQTVQASVKDLESPIETEYSTDITELISLGAMGSPALLIDGELKIVGRVPSAEELKTLIQQAQNGESVKPETGKQGGCSCGGRC